MYHYDCYHYNCYDFITVIITVITVYAMITILHTVTGGGDNSPTVRQARALLVITINSNHTESCNTKSVL